jgi:hypothetical protein
MGVKFTLLMQLGTSFEGYPGLAGRLGGWSESHYQPGLALPSNAVDLVKVLARKRAAFLPGSGSVVGYRIGLVDVATPQVKTGQLFYPGDAAYGNDVPQMGIKIDAYGQMVPNKKELELRGIPDSQVVKGEFSPDAPFRAALWAFLVELQTNWCFRGKNLANPTYGINFVDTTGLVTLINPAAFAKWQQVQVLRSKNSAGRQKGGLYQISDNAGAPNLYTLARWDHGFTTGGKIRAVNFIYPPYFFDNSAVNFAESMVKKVGRPFHQYRGRKSAKTPG